MFPKDSSILVTNRIPTVRVRYEPRIKKHRSLGVGGFRVSRRHETGAPETLHGRHSSLLGGL